MKLEYELNKENYKELYSYMALHDRHIQKRLLYIMLSLSIGVIVLAIFILRLSLQSILASVIGIILIFVLFPKFYWKVEFKRVDMIVDKLEANFNKMKINIDKLIEVKDGEKRYLIHFNDIQNIDFTKSNCMIFYKQNEKINTLIIPNSVFTDEELKKFYLDIKGRIQDGKK